MNGVMDRETAESIRSELVARNVSVRQLTNLSKIDPNWTEYSGSLKSLIDTRNISTDLFEIQHEILIFDDTVALYRTEPQVSYTEIEDVNYASVMRSLFENLWKASQMMVWGINGSISVKQYLPMSMKFGGKPSIVYPAKDDGNISQAYPGDGIASITEYLHTSLALHSKKLEDADMLILYVWNDGIVPMVDVWKVMRNSISDDSGFLYDNFTLKGNAIDTSMGEASGNSLIVFTAEEFLLRRLIIEEGKTFLEASDRELYFPIFPAGLMPSERFREKLII